MMISSKKITHQEIAIKFSSMESEEFFKWVESINAPKVTHLKAIESMKVFKGEEYVAAYNKWLAEIFSVSKAPDSKGKRPPVTGETRNYKPQYTVISIRDSQGEVIRSEKEKPVVKVNLDTLNLKGDDEVSIEFGDQEIVIRKKKV